MTRVLLPQVYGNAAVAGQGEQYPMNARAVAFAHAWLELLGERADLIRYDDRLGECAELHAQYLAQRLDSEPSMHIGRDASTPNERVRASGYALPAWWPVAGNQVESCARSWETPQHAAQSLAEHDTHREHMLGLNWYIDHLAYGVGNAAEYYVALTAPVEQSV